MKRAALSAGAVIVAGFVLVALQLLQGLQQVDEFEGRALYVVFVVETLPFVVVGLALMYVGSWLATESELADGRRRVVAWGVGGVVLFVSVAALVVFSLQVSLGTAMRAQAPFVAVNLVTVGALAGILVGLYDARSRRRQRALERERDRVQRFANRAADLNTYGRELNRSGSVTEVSSLSLQATGAVLGLTSLAFVVADGEEAELVDDTTDGVDRETLVGLAFDSLDQQPATATRHDLPDGGEALTLLVTDGQKPAVLVALTDDTALGEDRLRLLEMLVAHAATALDRLAVQEGSPA